MSSERFTSLKNLARGKSPFSVYPIMLSGVIMAGGLGYEHRHEAMADLAGISRSVVGDEFTARLESVYFLAADRKERVRYGILGGQTNPFEDPQKEEQESKLDQLVLKDIPVEPSYELLKQEVSKPTPLVLPEVKKLQAEYEEGEGAWTTEGLPRTSPEDILMAKTFVRPDVSRPYASVGALILDKRRIKLNMVGGPESPGGDRGVRGFGRIPDADRSDLLVAWNGGFQGPHGGFGMYADGKQYRPLVKGLASVAVAKDGTITMGEWGRTLFWNDDLIAVRQNAALLVEDCEVSKLASEQGQNNDIWGYVDVNTTKFITWRSAIGLTKNGDLLVAAGSNLSAASLARALWAVGACTAMQLDINSPYVLTSLFSKQSDGSVKASRFMNSMSDNPARFLETQPRDFMYVTFKNEKSSRDQE